MPYARIWYRGWGACFLICDQNIWLIKTNAVENIHTTRKGVEKPINANPELQSPTVHTLGIQYILAVNNNNYLNG
jgi:hypothetical protein